MCAGVCLGMCAAVYVGMCFGDPGKTQMAMGRGMRPEQPDPQTAGPSGLGDLSETVPEEVLELWASLPRRERQRRRRRYYRDQAACCSRPALTETLSTIDTRVRILEDTLAEFLHATAASIPVPPTRSSMERTREDAGSLSSPAPASTSNEILPDISRAEKLCSDALSPSPLQPAVAASALAAVPTDPASRSADVPMAEPTSRLA